MNKIILCLLAIILLQGCATPYQSLGYRGGYTETQLGPTTFRVSFKGNDHIDLEKAEDFVLLRSAELALENIYPYFSIQDSSADRKGPRIWVTKTIYMSKTEPQDGIMYDSEFIYKALTAKYAIKP